MESTTVIKLESLEPYRHLFPKALAVDKTVKMGAGVSDTVAFIPMIIKGTQWQVEQFVNQELRGLNTYDACEKLWHFVKLHIKYKKDKRGVEQVRSARRLIHDGVGDCDCFTTFIGTCLTALHIPIINRITKYKENFFQHIYPIVPIGNGKYITMDCVVDEFNYEEPYTEKKDYKMDLQYLDGIEDEKLNGNVDVQDLFGWNDDKDLGKLFKRQVSSAMPEENQGGQGNGKHKRFQKFKKFAKKALNIANKANPATALLRAGILASMKLNIMKVAQRLKWAYLSEDEARAKGADMSRFTRLKKVLYKIEQIFYTAGGNPTNLRKSIISGRGNRHHEVSGFGNIGGYDTEMLGINEYSPLPTVLEGVYQDEFVNGLEGTEGLGSAVATGAAITAATTVMTAIAALLKSVGNVFPGKKKNPDFKEDGGNTGDGGSTNESSDNGSSSNDEPSVNTNSNSGNSNSENNSSNNNSASENSSPPATTNNETSMRKTNTSETPENEGTNGSANKGTDANDKEEEPKTGIKAFWENNKKWIKPVGVGLGIASLLFAGYKAWSKNKNDKSTTPKTQAALNGVRKKRRAKKGKQKTGRKVESIAFM